MKQLSYTYKHKKEVTKMDITKLIIELSSAIIEVLKKELLKETEKPK